MTDIKAERLKAAREQAGFESAAAAAQNFGWTQSAYRHHENGTRGFGADAATKYGRAFRVKPAWLLGLDPNGSVPTAPNPTGEEVLVVNGSVEAGVWRASETWDDDRAFTIEGMPSPIPGAQRFGVVVAGQSMNLFYEPGTVLDCVSIFAGGAKPETGDHVIVEQVRPDGLREMTVKEYREEGGRYQLVPRSNQAHYQALDYPGPDAEHGDDGEVRVIAFVMAAYPPRTLNLMKRMGVIKPLTR